MNKNEKIMIFGGGMLQNSLIKTANNLGYYTIVIDPDPNALGKGESDEFIVVAGNDFERTFEIAKNNNIKGLVTTATDNPLLMMAEVAEKLNLAFSTKRSVNNTINKFKLKQIFVSNNIPCAKGVLANFSELEEKLKQSEMLYPLIVKPIDSSGSRGVYYCSTKNELTNAYFDSVKYSNFDKVLIEEFLEGPEISIEALVQNDFLYIVQITDKTTTPFPYNVEMGHLQPSRFYRKYYDEIYQILSTAVKSLKLNDCALHPEMKITTNGIKIVEIGPRLGGDFITSHLTPLSTGINIEEQLLKIAVGKKINIERIHNRFSAVLFFDFLQNKISKQKLEQIIEKVRDKISEFKIYYSEGTVLPTITNSLERHGHVVFSANSLEELLSVKERIINSKAST